MFHPNRVLAILTLSLLLVPAISAQEDQRIPLEGGKHLEVIIIKPKGLRITAETALPLMLALPPGGQDRRMAQVAVDMIGKAAAARGYFVAVPIKREKTFVQGGEHDLPALFEWIEKQQAIDRSRSLVMGISNGGRSAMRVLTMWPERFAGAGMAPGILAAKDPTDKLEGKAIWVRVGEKDSEGWLTGAEKSVERLKKAGCVIDYQVVKGGEHVIPIDMNQALGFFEAKIQGFRRVEIKSKGDLVVVGELYETGDKTKPTILFCHQAGSSRGEYRTIAARLKAAGYNGLAIDQRSGRGGHMIANFVKNETAAAFAKPGERVPFLAARPDIEAALDWLTGEGFRGKRALWGSSYSSALAIVIGSERKDVDAVLSFAPGEYLGTPGMVAKAASAMKKPILIVSPEGERKRAAPIHAAIPKEAKKEFLIDKKIAHGSRTLFLTAPATREMVWKQVEAFLKKALAP